MKNNTKIIIALATGTLIGSLMGLLMAPDNGKEMRKKMKEQGKKMKKQAGDFLNEAKEKLKAVKKEGTAYEGAMESMVE